MKKTRILLPLAILGLMFSVVACNGGQEENKPSGESSATSQQTSSQAAQEKITVTAAEGKNKLLKGETAQLTAKVGDAVLEGVKWESAKPEIASVTEAGLVTALTKGSASIKATKEGYKDGSISITVDYPNITVTAADNKTTLLVGETVQLTSSEQGVTWTSSDATIASVENGLVTANKLGEATIAASKDGFNSGSIAITVARPKPNLVVDMTSDATHYSADGWWELPSSGGYGFAMQTVDGPTPIAKNSSWGQQTEEGDTFIGGFGVGDKETVSFTSSLAAKAEVVLNIGNSTAATLSEVMTIKLNGTAIDLTGITLEEHAGQYGMASLEFADVSLGESTLAIAANNLEIEMLADNNLFLNGISFYAGQATMDLIVPQAKTQIELSSEATEVIAEETLQLTANPTDVEFISLDETIATVDQTGLVTGVKMGKVNIRAKKEGYYSNQIEITVNPKPVAGQIIIEAENGEEVSDSYGGSSYMRQADGGMMGGSAVHSGGAYVTYFSMGGGDVDLTLTLKFQATEDKTMVLSIVGNAPINYMGGDASPYVFADYATITLNENPVDVAEDAQFPAPQGYTAEMVEIVLGDVNVQAGENTLVFHTTGVAPSIDCFKLSAK